MTGKLRIFNMVKTGWDQKYRITVINALVTILLIAVIVVVLLTRAGYMHRQTVEENLVSLTGKTALEIQSLYFTYFGIAYGVSQAMETYQTMDVNQRRSSFNDLMEDIIISNSSLVSIYTIWQPNALDERDARYANTAGTDASGQYITGFTRENGYLEMRAFPEYKNLLREENWVSYVNETLTNPVARKIANREDFVVDLRVPIMVNSVALGFVGITVNLEQLQILVDSLKPLQSGRLLLISNDGTIAAYYDRQFRGHNILMSEARGIIAPDFQRSFIQTILNSINTSEPAVLRTKEQWLISYPFNLGTNSSTWSVITLIPLATVMAPIYSLFQFSIIFIAIAGAFAAGIIYLTSNSLTRHALALQQDLERATAMQDNLKYGLFLIDSNLIIQGAYSKALEKILSIPELQGKRFTDILSASLNGREIQGLTDYFEMVFKRAYDEKMLADINPINEFSYISAETGEGKSLRSTFALVEWQRNTVLVLGTLEDITAEVELSKQLKEAEDTREKEMRSIFQVIQLNPRVLDDFIEEAEFEFDEINKTLRNRKISPQKVLVEIYQSIHAIKSNALILNLENFSSRLHKLETTIKKLQEQPEVPFDGILGIILDLEQVMKEKDQLKQAVTKIENFRQGVRDNSQEVDILFETLNRVCAKARSALNKNVRLVKGNIDKNVLTHGPRRVIKEVLTQLVRNAVYHGIETPAERLRTGKYSLGDISFSIWHKDNKAYLKVDDDGRGIDYDRVREQAQKQGLIHNPNEAANRDYLIQALFMPGFSTVENADMYAGRGVGLSLVRDRVKELQGSIKIRSEPEKGTSFIITIPLELPAEALTPII
ncbi:hypothetical protein AGMMS50293_11690 [Spirochaetia bacterium]|nr:hypothetical protein AGMMS50293_11690 [Spirochaetia bacterium]